MLEDLAKGISRSGQSGSLSLRLETNEAGRYALQAALTPAGGESARYRAEFEGPEPARALSRELSEAFGRGGVQGALAQLRQFIAAGVGHFVSAEAAVFPSVSAPYAPSGELRPELEAVLRHPFRSGFEEELQSGEGCIIWDGRAGSHLLIRPLARASDPVWSGDCSVDAALCFAVLERIVGREALCVQRLDFRFPVCPEGIPHFRVVLRDHPEISFQHSAFYAGLDASAAVVTELSVGDKPYAPQYHFKIGDSLNFKEFEHDGRRCLLIVRTVAPAHAAPPAEVQLLMVLAVQDEGSGALTHTFNVQLPVPLAGRRAGARIEPPDIKAWTYRDGGAERVVACRDDRLRHELQTTYQAVAHGLLLGRDQEYAKVILLRQMTQMRARPTSWWC
jgi:hypothetical protein